MITVLAFQSSSATILYSTYGSLMTQEVLANAHETRQSISLNFRPNYWRSTKTTCVRNYSLSVRRSLKTRKFTKNPYFGGSRSFKVIDAIDKSTVAKIERFEQGTQI